MVRRYNGEDLLRVLTFYGLITQDITTTKFKIICPFHDDLNASMSIDLSDGSFYCFGCGVKGDAREFVARANPELNDLGTCVALEKIIRSNEVKEINVTVQKKKKKNNRQALREAKDYYYGLRSVDWTRPRNEEEREALKYLTDRGFGADALNFVGCKATYDKYYPVVFPILDNGEFRGYVCRTNDKRVEHHRKYLYNEAFNKRHTLCGNYGEGKVVYLCEGYFDYLSLMSRGRIKNVCAVLGWHISDGQVDELKNKHVTTVVSALDNDKCGEKGTELLKKYFNVIRFKFPNGVKDPGDMTEEQIRRAKRKVHEELRSKANDH